MFLVVGGLKGDRGGGIWGRKVKKFFREILQVKCLFFVAGVCGWMKLNIEGEKRTDDEDRVRSGGEETSIRCEDGMACVIISETAGG